MPESVVTRKGGGEWVGGREFDVQGSNLSENETL